MNPETHLLASWVIGAQTTDNARDCRLVALAGILPDADGLGLIPDAIHQALGIRGGSAQMVCRDCLLQKTAETFGMN